VKQSSFYAVCYSGARLLQPIGFRNDAEETISATTEFRLCEAAQLLKQSNPTAQRSKSSSFVTTATLDHHSLVRLRDDEVVCYHSSCLHRLCERVSVKQSSATVQRSKSSSFVTTVTLVRHIPTGFAMTAKKSSSCRIVSCNAGEEAVKTQKQSSAWVVLAAGLLCSHHL